MSREPIDSKKLPDSGKDFDGIYKQYYDPSEREQRNILKRREEREKNTKEDLGI